MRILLSSTSLVISELVREGLEKIWGGDSPSVRSVPWHKGLVSAELRRGGYDIVVLGYESIVSGSDFVVHEVREVSSLPILILSEERNEEFELFCFRTAVAEVNFLSPPFTAHRIRAYLEALSRRYKVPREREPVVCGGLLEVHVETATCKVRGKNIPVTASELRILGHMVAHPEMYHSREALLWVISGERATEKNDRTVDSHIKRLRKKIADAGGDGHIIETKVRIGYRVRRG